MNALSNYYQTQFEAQISSGNEPVWLTERRQAAFQVFTDKGLPDRKVEHWKYTSVEALKTIEFSKAEVKKGCNGGDNHTLVINNGRLCCGGELELPEGVIVCSINQAIMSHPELVASHLSRHADFKADGFAAINLALFEEGIFIFVPKNVQVKAPLYIEHHQSMTACAHHLRHCIVLEKNAQLTVVESYHGDDALSYFTNSVTEISTAPNARLDHYKIQCEGDAAFHIGTTHVSQARDSVVNAFSYSFGGKLVRSDTCVDLTGSGAHCDLQGLYMVSDKQHVDHHTLVNHLKPHSTSNEYYKGVLGGHAKGVFNGRVVVAKDAQKTDASQQNKNLLLSKTAQIATKPQLEIFADDVKCAHGATVGQLDEQALFYLQTRGLSIEAAKELLVQAFANDLIEKVTIAPVNKRLHQLVSLQLEKVNV